MLKDKVLFIAHYREDSGWGKVGRGYINALNAAGFEVAARPVVLGNATADIDEVVDKAEKTSSNGCRFLIQHVLPHYMEYSGGFDKCVGIVDLDSKNLQYTGWLENLRLMSEVWTPNTESTSNLAWELGKPVFTVPHAFDLAPYGAAYKPVDLQLPAGYFTFYTVCDLNRRKNLAAMVKAFHLAFPIDTPVQLVLKVHKKHANADEVYSEVNNLCAEVKKALRLYPRIEDYKHEIIVSEEIPEEGIYRLHSSCDCYVSSSYGEAWCIPAFEAMAFGNKVIASNTGGPRDFLPCKNQYWCVDGRWEPCFGMMETFNNLFTGYEDWFNIDVRELALAMQRMYQQGQTKHTEGLKLAEGYSYENVGKIIKDRLYEQVIVPNRSTP